MKTCQLPPPPIQGKENGNYGPIDPTKNSTYTFLSSLLEELKAVFPDAYLHLGGDEVSFACWLVYVKSVLPSG